MDRPANAAETVNTFATKIYPRLLDYLRTKTDSSNRIVQYARERGTSLSVGCQILCVVEVLLQASACGHVAFVLGATPADSTLTRGGRKYRLGDLLPLAGLIVKNGPALRNRLRLLFGFTRVFAAGAVGKGQSAFSDYDFHDLLKDLGLCPPGPSSSWGQRDNSAWRLAWASNGTVDRYLALVHNQADPHPSSPLSSVASPGLLSLCPGE